MSRPARPEDVEQYDELLVVRTPDAWRTAAPPRLVREHDA